MIENLGMYQQGFIDEAAGAQIEQEFTKRRALEASTTEEQA